ncbi:MAG TPA: SdrD B-like domain-containing protein, partial [Methanoregulaceae archaeon]|nr:SdrD B-like domain-containing protein [Methanoregulaceae archaeon]
MGKNNLTPIDQVVEFGNYQHIGEVEAHVYSDDNGNSVWDIVNNESQLEFWTVNLFYPNNTFIASTVTDEDGEYEFEVPYGDYIVKEVPQSGWLQTQGKNGYSIEINNSSFYLTDQNFGNQYQQIFNITGYKYNDLNGNGKRDAGEPGLPGWNIGIGNTTLPYYATTITDATGNYSFLNVPKGTYFVNETLISGWHNTTFLNQTTCVPPFPYVPPDHLETIDGEVFYQSGGTPLGSDTAYLVTKITGINPTMGYDVQNTEYPAWCGDTSTEIQTSKPYEIYSFIPSYPPFPSDFVSDFPTVATTQWDKINYMLNKRSYYYSLGNNSQSFQAAIWNFTNSRPIEAAYYPFGGVSLTAAQIIQAKAIVADANANGAGYKPTCGGVEGMFLNIEQEDYGPVQLTFFEVPVRCCLPVYFGNQQLGNITGYKNDSVSGAGLSGWNITLSNSTSGYFSYNITNNTGGFNFTSVPYGLYWLNETPQAGYIQSALTQNKTVTIGVNNLTIFYNFTNIQQLGNLSGYKRDGSGNGLSGWNITISNGTLPYFNSTLTNNTGGFSFTNIPWGIYQLNETPQPGWTQGTPNQTVEINGTSLLLVNRNFTNTQQFGNLSGYKRDGSGNGLSGWNITLFNSTLPYFDSMFTNNTGGFSFTNIPWGIYQLNETPQPGWTQVTLNQSVEINGTSLLLVNQNFTNTQQLGNLSGYKRDGSGNGLSGWNITISNSTLPYFDSMLTNNTGGFSFTNIPWGIYQLNEMPQPGWTQVTANMTVEINGTSLLLVNQNFTNTQQLGNITGDKVNYTGSGLGGWTITLTNKTIGTPAYSNVTDPAGV